MKRSLYYHLGVLSVSIIADQNLQNLTARPRGVAYPLFHALRLDETRPRETDRTENNRDRCEKRDKERRGDAAEPFRDETRNRHPRERWWPWT